MGFQVSPGVQSNEVDLTTIVPSVSTTDGALVGVFSWGPLSEIVLLGDENELATKFGKPDDNTATSFFTAANFLAYGNKLRLVRVASTVSTTSAGTATSSGTTVTTSGLVALGVRIGDTITSGGQVRTITVVTNDTTLTTDTAFSPALSGPASVTFSIYAGALNSTADGVGILIKNNDHYDSSYLNGQASVGLWAAKYPGKLGNSLTVSLCPSANAFKRTLSGTVSTTGTAVTGSSTQFVNETSVGTYIKDPLSGEERKITVITSATAATIESAFTTNLSSATVTARWQYSDSIGIAPGTSDYAVARTAVNDELHVVVVDTGGEWSGIKGTVLERHSFLSKASDARSADGSSTYYVTAINRASKYIRWMDHLSTGTNWGSAAAGLTFTAVNIPNTVGLAGGRDINTGAAIDGAKSIGYDLFRDADAVDVSFVMLGEATTTVASYVINNIAERRKDCVAFISPERNDVVNNYGNEVTDSIQFRNTLPSTSYAVMDSGWKYQFDKYNDVYRWVPLNGDIAGLCVRTDIQTDPWFSPAGYNRGNIKNVIKLAYSPYKAQRDDLYLAGINPVINEAGQGTILFGDKTLLAKPSAFDRINVRRLFIILEKSISKAAKSSLFEINDEFTRAAFRNLVEPYLRDVQGRRGIFDFRVVCDSTNNTGEVIDRNEFRGDIYVKPSRSINFINLNFVAVRTGVEFTEIVGKF